MEKGTAEYFARVLTEVTLREYIAVQDGLDNDDYAVCLIALNGKKQIQPNGNIRVALNNAASLCRNALNQL